MKSMYTKEFKRKVVKEYLKGGISLRGIAAKYGIQNHHTVSTWVKGYQEHGDAFFKNTSKGEGKLNIYNLDYKDMNDAEKIRYLEMENAILKKLSALMKK